MIGKGFVGLVPERDDVASALAALGLYSAREGVVDHGHAVPADEPLWPGTEMRSFIVLRPLGNFLPPLELADPSRQSPEDPVRDRPGDTAGRRSRPRRRR